jgi:hypothetical protein
MAPISAAKTIVRVRALASTIPVAIVVATLIERKAPMRFMSAARPTATRGRSAPVAMEVAIALAVSWKPLVKSKASAVTTTMTRSSSEPMRQAFPFHAPAREKSENERQSA